jgi:3-deoxy-D-manno-octulosonic acid hydroxylase-like protein
MSWTEINDYRSSRWQSGSDPASRSRHYCSLLEQGQILFFPQPPFSFPNEDREFLVQQKPADSRLHKNISYRPTEDRMRGFAGTAEEQSRMHRILQKYSAEVVNFVSSFLAPYAGKCTIDFASFRPLEEEGRDLSLHKRNDLLHVDAFPSRPTRGGRILRVFTNVHPLKNRVWITSDRFPALAERFAKDAGLLPIAAGAGGSLRARLSSLLHSVGLPVADRSAYDQFMLRFHDYLKENSDFQANCMKFRSEFPPMATWLVFTDGVPHAALSGQFALEQTFIIPPEALVAPEHAPIRVLEKLCGKHLA